MYHLQIMGKAFKQCFNVEVRTSSELSTRAREKKKGHGEEDGRYEMLLMGGDAFAHNDGKNGEHLRLV